MARTKSTKDESKTQPAEQPMAQSAPAAPEVAQPVEPAVSTVNTTEDKTSGNYRVSLVVPSTDVTGNMPQSRTRAGLTVFAYNAYEGPLSQSQLDELKADDYLKVEKA